MHFQVSGQQLGQLVMLLTKGKGFIELLELDVELDRLLGFSTFNQHQNVLISEPSIRTNLLLKDFRTLEKS
jgi:hypothetical protein